MKWFNDLNLPNKLTIIRILLIPIFLFFLFASKGVFRVLPLLIFIAASLTDAVDGYIARRDNLVTDFGKFMDPLADKLLTTAAFVSFVQIGYMGAVSVVIILSREFLISGFRTLAASKGITIAANSWGKIKTVFQMALIILILINYAENIRFISAIINPMIFITILLTIISGVTYLAENIDKIK